MHNKDIIKLSNDIFSPVQMYISRDSGECNGDMLPARDIIINLNSLKCISGYTLDEVREIEECMAM